MMTCASLDSFTCSVCLEVYKRPVRTACGHIFCGECILGCTACPVCRGHVEERCTRDRKTEREINTLSVLCTLCNQTVMLKSYRLHSSQCESLHPVAPIVTSHTMHTAEMPANRMTYSCPYCDKCNIDCGVLLAHLNEKHSKETRSAVCPVCAAMPWGNPHQKSNHLVRHFNLRHKFEYDRFVEYDQDEEESLREVLAKSLEDQ